jgi:hypothetical protein
MKKKKTPTPPPKKKRSKLSHKRRILLKSKNTNKNKNKSKSNFADRAVLKPDAGSGRGKGDTWVSDRIPRTPPDDVRECLEETLREAARIRLEITEELEKQRRQKAYEAERIYLENLEISEELAKKRREKEELKKKLFETIRQKEEMYAENRRQLMCADDADGGCDAGAAGSDRLPPGGQTMLTAAAPDDTDGG